METYLTLSTLVLALLLGGVTLLLSYRHFAFGLSLSLVLFVLRAVLFGDISFSLGPINLFLDDAIYVLLLMAAILRFTLRNNVLWARWMTPFFLFVIFVFVSYARGLGDFGLQSATNAFRESLYLLSGAFYVSTFTFSQRHFRLFTSLCIVTACALVALTIWRWTAELLGLPQASAWLLTGRGSMRVLDAHETLFLAQIALVSLLSMSHKNIFGPLRQFSYFLLPIAVLLQHRTIWLVILGSLLLAFRSYPEVRPKLVRVGIISMILGAAGLTVIFGQNGLTSIEDRSTNTGTLEWRVEGWQKLITSQLNKPDAILLGRPFGHDFYREFVPGYGTNVSPHNHYVLVLLKTGVLGLLVWLWLYGVLLQHLYRQRPRKQQGSPMPNVLFILLITQLIYSFTYSPSTIQGLILGLAMSQAFSFEPAPAAQAIRDRSYLWQR